MTLFFHVFPIGYTNQLNIVGYPFSALLVDRGRPLTFSWLNNVKHTLVGSWISLFVAETQTWWVESLFLLLQHVLVGGLVAIFYFPIYWECHHPNWLSYFSEGWPNHQPVLVGEITPCFWQLVESPSTVLLVEIPGLCWDATQGLSYESCLTKG